MGKTLVVFDFDWSFVDQDTDRWVFEVLSTKLRRLLETRKSAGSQCTPDVVNDTMGDLAEEGFTKDQVLDALRILPFHPAMRRAVLGLRERNPNVEYLCLSNSNEVYISTILERHGLTDLFSNIITNPASWNSSNSNRLDIGRRVPANGPQHDCKVGCLANMCKGEELEAYISERGGRSSYEKIVYIGDGGNDFCPLLRMKEGDWALVRKNMELDARIKNEGEKEGLKVEVKKWSQAWQIDEYFQEL
ncbi:phosphatase phospho-type [Kockovaella imperatae]|uniref:Phosphatase phospho-type n=1 Tax=Kockovaella imperatae TaxID=4999 RepID=A0A1Y1UR31_9TREE|nr:phosphatase phospho-type [Kockovaella imperatae]ORX40538.1 phosphatase phospho-type [Kockovaella imperatae]